MVAEEILAMAIAISSILWSIAYLILFGIFVWAIYIVLQVANDAKGYYRDLIGFHRGKIHKAADIADIEIIIEPKEDRQENLNEINKILKEYKDKSKLGPKK